MATPRVRMDFIIMKYHLLFLLFTSSLCSPQLSAWSLWGSKKPKSNQDDLTTLQKKQVDKPLDPFINYNYGVALYRAKKYEQARENFKRALEHAKGNVELIKRSYFNAGNCEYKNCLTMLSSGWEKKDIEEELILKAITEINGAIADYKSYFVLDKDAEDRKTNLIASEELLKKLEEKLKKQQQGKQDKQNQDKKDQDQKGNDKQEQGDKQDKNSQDQNGKQDKSNENKDSKDQAGNDKDKQEQKKEQADSKKEEKPKEEEKPAKEEQGQHQEQQAEASPQQEEAPVEDREMREMSALLETLDQQEKDTQKEHLKSQLKQAGKSQNNQKAW